MVVAPPQLLLFARQNSTISCSPSAIVSLSFAIFKPFFFYAPPQLPCCCFSSPTIAFKTNYFCLCSSTIIRLFHLPNHLCRGQNSASFGYAPPQLSLSLLNKPSLCLVQPSSATFKPFFCCCSQIPQPRVHD